MVFVLVMDVLGSGFLTGFLSQVFDKSLFFKGFHSFFAIFYARI
ncbi:hypothetical protein X559_3188 [Paenilisteria newyorkensis]|nr:hypothetical protein X559_3188 [Listeria newyorkensis]